MTQTQRDKMAERIIKKIIENPTVDYRCDPIHWLVDVYYCIVLIEDELRENAKDFDIQTIAELRHSFQYKDTDWGKIQSDVFDKITEMTDEFVKEKIITTNKLS